MELVAGKVFYLYIFLIIHIWLKCPVPNLVPFCFEECSKESNNSSQKLKKTHFSLFNREQIRGTIQEKSIYSMFSNVVFFIFPFKMLLYIWFTIVTWKEILDTRVVFTEFSEYGNNSGRVVYWSDRSFSRSSRLSMEFNKFWHFSITNSNCDNWTIWSYLCSYRSKNARESFKKLF